METAIYTKEQYERDVTTLWEPLADMDIDEPGRQDIVEAAMHQQKQLTQKYNCQNNQLQLFWNVCHQLNPENPCAAAELIISNIDILIKSLGNTGITTVN